MLKPRLPLSTVGVRFTINTDPVGQGRARFTKSGHAYTPTKTRNAQAVVKLAAEMAMRAHGDQCFAGPLELSLRVFIRIPRSKPKKWQAQARSGAVWPTTKPDLSNIIKLIEDAMTGTVYLDDKQIVSLNVRKLYADSPRIEVVVTPCGYTTMP
jgi:Holliday junction resolvase RusA-like endonuclease